MEAQKRRALRSLRLLQVESVLGAMLIHIPVLTLFFYRIGLGQSAIGASQAVAVFAFAFLNIPTGWVADRFSRKKCNVIGDGVTAAAYLLLAVAPSFSVVVIAEILSGFGLALTNGADQPLIEEYCHELGLDPMKQAARIHQFSPIVQALAMVIGGAIGSTNPRIAVIATAIPVTIGMILTSMISENRQDRMVASKKPESTKELWSVSISAFRDMGRIVKESLYSNRVMFRRVIGFGVASSFPQVILFVTTPMLLLAGVPLGIVGLVWAVGCLMTSLGATLAHRYSSRLTDATNFAIEIGAAIAASFALALSLNRLTACLYLVLGLSRGWGKANFSPIVSRKAPVADKSTVLSVAGTVSLLTFTLLVFAINAVGGHSIRWAFAENAIVFAVICLPLYIGMRREDPHIANDAASELIVSSEGA